MTKAREYFYGIDLVRFSSALMVACFHIGYSCFKPDSRGATLVDGTFTFPQGAIFFWGSVGVQIFFVISGFVIANSANGSTPFLFLKSRVQRLYPAVWICASISCCIWLISGAEPAQEVIFKFLHTLTLWPLGAWIDAPYWTIACEIAFYGLIFLLLLGRSFNRLQAFAVGMVFVSAGFWTLYLIKTWSGASLPFISFFVSGAGRILPVYYGPFFGLGMLMWVWRRNGLSPLGWIAIFIALTFGLIETIGVGSVTSALDGGYAAGWGAERFVRASVWLGACVVILISSGHSVPGNIAPSTLRVLRNIGLATYPLYLLHFALGVWTMRLLVTGGGFPPVLAFVVALFIVCSLSFLVTIHGEPLLRGLIRGAFNRLEEMLNNYDRFAGLLHRSGGAVPARLLKAPAAQ